MPQFSVPKGFLKFRLLRRPSPEEVAATRSREWQPPLDLFRELGLKHDEYGWTKLALNSPAVPALLNHLEADANLEMQNYPELTLLPAQRKTPPEWYNLWPTAAVEYYGDEEDGLPGTLPRIHASRVRKGAHLGCYNGWQWRICVDEEVRKALTAAACRGARFAWIQDMGERPAPQWFLLIPDQGLGPEVMSGPEAQIREVTSSRNPVLPADAPDWLRLLSRAHSPRILSPPRTRRANLPDSDFAWWRRHGMLSVCVSARIRDLLLEKELATPRMFEGLEIEDEAADNLPSGIAAPREAAPDASPYWPVEKLLAEAEKRYQVFLARTREKTPASCDLHAVLQRWASARLTAPETFGPGADEETLRIAEHQLRKQIPIPWRRFLLTVGYGDLSELDALELEFPSVLQLQALQKSAAAWFEGSRVPRGYLFVGQKASGDMYALDTAHTRPDGDCPVVFISHEGPSVEAEWTGIGEFLSDVITDWETAQEEEELDPIEPE